MLIHKIESNLKHKSVENSRMPNYQLGKIYKVYCVSGEPEDVYYGSTTEALSRRMAFHRSGYKQWKKNNNFRCTSYVLFDKYDVENCIIELVENYPCNTIEMLKAREGYYQSNNHCVNRNIAGRSRSEGNKEWLKTHKEEKKKCDKEYRQNNKEKIREYKKKYSEENKEHINERRTEKYTCKCGSEIQTAEKSRHERAKKHKKYLETLSK